MKKAILALTLSLLAFGAAAQMPTYRQNINQEIRQLIVQGNCIVRLQQDTSNWIAYKGTDKPDTARLVLIENNILTTLPAANNKTLYVGTTSGKDCNLEFEVKGDAVVLYNEKAYTGGNHVSTRTFDDGDKDNPKTHNWTGLSEYGPYDRLFLDYYFGNNFWTTGNSLTSSPIYPTKMSFGTATVAKLGYSLYMDNHIAAGFGLQYEFYNTPFKSPLVSYSSETNRLFTATSDSAGTWNTSTVRHTIGIPFHLTFYPNSESHKFNLQLELIPQFSFNHMLDQNYYHESDGLTINNNYTRDLPYSLFNLSTRFNINYGAIGFYAEYGITPTCRNIGFDNMTLTPHHACIGLRYNIFELGK